MGAGIAESTAVAGIQVVVRELPQFLDAATKARLLADYERRVAAFAEGFRKEGWAALRNTRPETYGFICRRYQICMTR